MSVIEWLLRLFGVVREVEVSLEFEVDVDGCGRQVIEVFKNIDGERSRLGDVEEAWNYGYSFQRDDTRYVLSDESFETLLTLRSMNPQVTESGKIVSQVYPTVLNYLRERKGVIEEASSREIIIREEPLSHRAEVSYDPSRGVRVEAGYQVPGLQDVVQLGDLKTSPSPGYVEFEGSFYRLPEEDAEVREWVEEEEKTVGLDDVPEFFKHDLVLLKTRLNAELTEEARGIEVVEERFQPIVRLDYGGRGWLDFTIDYEVGEHELPHEFFQRDDGEHVRLDEDTWIKVDKPSLAGTDKQLETLSAHRAGRGYRVEVTRFLSLEEAIERIGGVRRVSAEYQRFIDEITGFKHDPSYTLPPQQEEDLASSGIILRPYQREGIHWLHWLTSRQLHAVLADDMGLGKTLQTIAAMRITYESTNSKSHSLVVCPKSVIGHWRREFKRVYPNISVYTYLGQARDRYRFVYRQPIVFITTYATMSRDIDVLRKIPFLFVVLDEGTRIKNPGAKRSVAAKTLNAAHRLVLSGTPIENRPLELWSIFDFLMRGHLGSPTRFISEYERPLQEEDAETAGRLAELIRPFILRRSKEEVAEDLPEKIEMQHWCELTTEQKSLYGQIQEMYVSPLRSRLQRGEDFNYTSLFPILTKLKQVCDHPALITGEKEPLLGRSEKFDFILKTLRDVVERGEAAVLFTHFLGALDLFELHLQDKGVDYIRIDGSTENRQELIDRFNAEKASIALCSLMATSHGINLTAARHVLHLDRWWNPATEDQATDRVHRIGQTQTVYVYKVLTEGTLEEKIDALLEKKRGISDMVIGAATQETRGWTREELLEILKPVTSS